MTTPEAGAAMAGEFVLKVYRLSVDGHGEWPYYARSRASAIGKAYHDWRSLRDEGDFKTFLRIVRCRTDGATFPSRFGDPITVNGRPAFFVENNRQYVRLVWPGGDHVSNAHPLEVKPIEYRPDTYRSEKFDAQ